MFAPGYIIASGASKFVVCCAYFTLFILVYFDIEKILGRTEQRGECYPIAGQAGEDLRGCGGIDLHQCNLFPLLF